MTNFYRYRWHNYTDIWYDLKTMSQVWNTVWLPSPCGYSPGASKEIYNSVSMIVNTTILLIFCARDMYNTRLWYLRISNPQSPFFFYICIY